MQQMRLYDLKTRITIIYVLGASYMAYGVVYLKLKRLYLEVEVGNIMDTSLGTFITFLRKKRFLIGFLL